MQQEVTLTYDHQGLQQYMTSGALLLTWFNLNPSMDK